MKTKLDMDVDKLEEIIRKDEKYKNSNRGIVCREFGLWLLKLVVAKKIYRRGYRINLKPYMLYSVIANLETELIECILKGLRKYSIDEIEKVTIEFESYDYWQEFRIFVYKDLYDNDFIVERDKMEDEKLLERIEVLSEKIFVTCKSYRDNGDLNTLATLKSIVETAQKEFDKLVL